MVITEGEYDAMAVYQATKFPTVSLPQGASHLPKQLMEFFDRFERIYLWLDADEVGQRQAEKFAEDLGIQRTFIIDFNLIQKFKNSAEVPKDANDVLRQGISFEEIIEEGTRLLHSSKILSLYDLNDPIMNRIINNQTLMGVKSQYFEFFNRHLKGLRMGELSILTGASGSGKTTFLSQLSIDFLSQGVPVLWGSFEIKNEVLGHAMVQQYKRMKLDHTNPEASASALQEFCDYPLHFMNFYGSTQVEVVFQALEHAIYAYDVQVICIDNLQFMLSLQAEGARKFDLQEKVINDLRRLATERNVHIFLIIHPKKVEDECNLNVASIFGSAKATQEADNVMILQKYQEYPGLRAIQVMKNRYDGSIGNQPLGFNPENKRYFEVSPSEFRVMMDSQGKLTVESLISHRKKKYDGEVEPNLNTQAQENRRSNLQNFKFKGQIDRVADIVYKDL